MSDEGQLLHGGEGTIPNAFAAAAGSMMMGGSRNPLDMWIPVTFFTDFSAGTKREENYTLNSLASRIKVVTAPEKKRLPWLKLARFGDIRTDKNSLRHDGNLLGIVGLEADYDLGLLSVDYAVEKLTLAGVAALVYTSPSHTEDKPRWRVLCPFSGEHPPGRRDKFMGRLNGLFGGAFSGESWTLSQSYYYGSVQSNPAHRVELINGTPIDGMNELDDIWLAKPNTETRPGTDGKPRSGPMDEAALLGEITSGNGYHMAGVRLAGAWALRGVPLLEAQARLLAAFDGVFPPDRDARWKQRRADVDRCLLDIYAKEGKARDEGRRGARPNGSGEGQGSGTSAKSEQARGPDDAKSDLTWDTPHDFLTDINARDIPLLEKHVPSALYPFIVDVSARLGVDPATVALSAIISCASVLSDEWKVQPKRYDTEWTENPRLWGAIVGEPSILKSPVIKACTRPIDLLDAAARENHDELMRRYKQELRAFEKDKSGDTPEPIYPKVDRYLVEGTTVEALTEILRGDEDAKQRAPAGKVLVRQDEMAEFFGNLDRYNAGGKGGGDRGAYLRLYNGGRYVYDRIGRGSFVMPNWSGCFLGGIQPGPIQRIAKDADDDGMLQRLLFAVPGEQSRGQDRKPCAEGQARYTALFPAMANLRPSHNLVVTFGHDAHQYRETVDNMARGHEVLADTSRRLKSAFGKWAGIYARLALTFHLIEIADSIARNEIGPVRDIIPAETAKRAADYMLDVVLPHLLRADALMFSTTQTNHTERVGGLIILLGQDHIAARDIMRGYKPFAAPEAAKDMDAVMSRLALMGWVRAIIPENQFAPVRKWAVNPAVFTMFPDRAEKERKRRAEAVAALDALKSRRAAEG